MATRLMIADLAARKVYVGKCYLAGATRNAYRIIYPIDESYGLVSMVTIRHGARALRPGSTSCAPRFRHCGKETINLIEYRPERPI
jgi:hypothetical protein